MSRTSTGAPSCRLLHQPSEVVGRKRDERAPLIVDLGDSLKILNSQLHAKIRLSSIIKRTKVGEDKIIEFRWEIFDLFNHANFGQPGRTAQVGSTTFGVITNTRFATGDSGSSRQMQFALKFKF